MPKEAASPTKPSPLSLDAPVTRVKGIAEAKARLLAKLGITTAEDLLTWYPRRYEDRSRFSFLADIKDGESAVFRVKIVNSEAGPPTKTGKAIVKVGVADDSGTATIAFFNQPWLRMTFLRLRGQTLPMYGTVQRSGFDFSLELRDVEWEEKPGSDSLMLGRIVPFYGLTEGLTQNTARKIMREAVPALAECHEDVLPDEMADRLDLMPVWDALRQIHWPESQEALDAARRRLVFEELFLLQTALAVRKKHETLDIPGIAFDVAPAHLDEFEAALPYTFTGAQRRVLDEITADMRLSRPMNRMLQGDVGSGKTVVAAAAMAAAAKAGYQAAVMAPTEILAEQHHRNMSALLTPHGLEVALLKGSMSAKEKREARERLAMGLTPIAVGTHALIQESVEFRNLGFVVVDEQHRFGVMQRAALKGKAKSPDVLVMTATPIPRTLALVVYGDLDVSVINELPPGRKPITTHIRRPDEHAAVYNGIERLLAQGRQAYVVCPLVSESEKLQAQAATDLYEVLQRSVFPHRRIALIHGQMPASEKDTAMTAFRAGEVDILVATTVIEVGVDVPNATCMVIEDAERFGLSQLHQLRGRVGRGSERSFCILIGDPNNPRLAVMADTSDGFAIAEQDLRLRGPGEFFGTRQSGMPSLKIANVIADIEILEEARREAFALIAADPDLTDPKHAPLRRIIETKYAELALTTVS